MSSAPTNLIDEREHGQKQHELYAQLRRENEMIRKKNAWQDTMPIMEDKDKKLSKAKIF